MILNLLGLRKPPLARFSRILRKINSIEEDTPLISVVDESRRLREKFHSFGGADYVVPEAYALVRRAFQESLGMRPYDVQLLGALALHNGMIAEMATGEGKTLVAAFPAYVNSIAGVPVHVVTVNDYLAERDSQLLKPVYDALGVSVGYITSNMSHEERQAAYGQDIVYATSSELAFDYLRDNMVMSPRDKVQRGLGFAIIDEVDSILIDEARTPLVISGAGELDANIVEVMGNLAGRFTVAWQREDDSVDTEYEADAVLDEKQKLVNLTEHGFEKAEMLFKSVGIIGDCTEAYSDGNLPHMGLLITAIKAIHLYSSGIDYLVRDGVVQIINQGTGRVEKGKRWSFGLHQAIEAKEGVEIKPDSQNMGTISLQNYFRMYSRVSGMSGTAYAEMSEFESVYGMGVVKIPPNKPSCRLDYPDQLYLTKEAKYTAIVSDILEKNGEGRPVLVGTDSVQESDLLSSMLSDRGVSHQKLNASNHEKEAQIIAEAGNIGAVTIATNMAGRGTDILLGGSLPHLLSVSSSEDDKARIRKIWEKNNAIVIECGGLHVIGSTRNDSRRIDDQLVGRAGRQGDPGSSQFYVSLDDRLMRLFAGSRYQNFFRGMGVKDNEAISHPILDKAIGKSQAQIESNNFSMRKELLRYDDVINQQRSVIYAMRDSWLEMVDPKSEAYESLAFAVQHLRDRYVPEGQFVEQWDLTGLDSYLVARWGLDLRLSRFDDSDSAGDEVYDSFASGVVGSLEALLGESEGDEVETVIRQCMIISIDRAWIYQLQVLADIREGIHLRSFAVRDVFHEYTKEAMKEFEQRMIGIHMGFIGNLFISLGAMSSKKD